ncbi:MoxR family ATPase [uncultured Methylophaga sp.]|uniref:AAA family ATPase n=1 Tax=uncultured Methylophaga sp. TaxID=285271 RepID=UPI0026256E40|nr:MoxR family ATPase [uncultured Methylophaga sp.]
MAQAQLAAILATVNDIILGKQHPIKLALTCLLAKGHLLIEDLPGVGKTTLAHTLATTLGLRFQRIQFTSDMLPADIIGVSIYERETAKFNFHPGPIFNQLILADEVNRASPRTQSALLEAMEEQQVTVEGQTQSLSSPFFVIATQNPANQIGTFPLPESQLDRFLMRIELGYPDARAERDLLLGQDRRELLQQLQAVITVDELLQMQQAVAEVHISHALVDYVQRILNHTRESGLYQTGLSPRAGLGLLRAGQAWAMIEGRDHVLPEDIQAVLPSIVSHRLQRREQETNQDWIEQLIHQVAIP